MKDLSLDDASFVVAAMKAGLRGDSEECARCGGLRVLESTDAMIVWRCLNCGDVEDDVVRGRRRQAGKANP